jgi:hypothetical protein
MDPALWLAVHGVPLSEYLEQLDRLAEVAQRVMALARQSGASAAKGTH